MKLYDFVQENWHRVATPPIRDHPSTEDLCLQLELLLEPNRRSVYHGTRVGKTLIGTVMFPVWAWQTRPDLRILIVQSRNEIAQNISVRFAEFAQRLEVDLSGQSYSMQHNPQGGFRATTTPLRFPAIQVDALILDDAFVGIADPGSVKLAREHFPCRLPLQGSMLELSG